ncbi:MAG TPA: efflux RND transporter periplasmic adaptor subunit [Ferruginibacter sp.]|nr:efflux RND transporter periplasmic adaptor subunit [Ferruginibacter sp.]HRE62148.1 efflux RND transporter periplasmic adaptor subunit [Ferruginibacter sp.]
MKKFSKILVGILVTAGLIALIGMVLTNNKKKNEDKTAVVAQTNAGVAVKTAKVFAHPMELNFTANGKFSPGQELEFSSETAGRVIRVLVDEGSYVRKGQTLAVIKTENLAVDVQTAREGYANALRDKQRYENAYKTGGVTQQQVDQAALAVQNAAARVQQASIKVSDANLRASINGIINKRMIEPGSVLAAGTKLFEIVDVSTLTLDVAVTEAQVANLKIGDTVTVAASVMPDKKFRGKISFIAAKADESLNFPVKIEVANNDKAAVKAGMYGNASFVFPQQEPVTLIPRSAFVGGVASNEVFIAQSGKAVLRKVVSGRIFGEQVEVIQGLAEGEEIITTGQINLVNGSAITVIK